MCDRQRDWSRLARRGCERERCSATGWRNYRFRSLWLLHDWSWRKRNLRERSRIRRWNRCNVNRRRRWEKRVSRRLLRKYGVSDAGVIDARWRRNRRRRRRQRLNRLRRLIEPVGKSRGVVFKRGLERGCGTLGGHRRSEHSGEFSHLLGWRRRLAGNRRNFRGRISAKRSLKKTGKLARFRAAFPRRRDGFGRKPVGRNLRNRRLNPTCSL